MRNYKEQTKFYGKCLFTPEVVPLKFSEFYEIQTPLPESTKATTPLPFPFASSESFLRQSWECDGQKQKKEVP